MAGQPADAIFVSPPAASVQSARRLVSPNNGGATITLPNDGIETPGSLACVYGLVIHTPGCNPGTAKAVPTGGSKVIVLVQPFDYPSAGADLAVFSSQFGLAAITPFNFQVVYARGKRPAQDPTGEWEFNAAMEIDMAHAFAPAAKLVLVEAPSNSLADLEAANLVARRIAEAAGGGEIVNAWGAPEFADEMEYERYYRGTNVVYLTGADFSAGPGFPGVLPDVITVAGTYVARNEYYNFINQQTDLYDDVGVGASAYVPIPRYQERSAEVTGKVGAFRGVPDVSFAAMNIWFYDTNYLSSFDGPPGWITSNSTAIATAALAGIINSAGHFAVSTEAELNTIYKGFHDRKNWTDMVIGVCGEGLRYGTRIGWDFCTGVGTPRGYGGL
jgi:hypothetical protein